MKLQFLIFLLGILILPLPSLAVECPDGLFLRFYIGPDPGDTSCTSGFPSDEDLICVELSNSEPLSSEPYRLWILVGGVEDLAGGVGGIGGTQFGIEYDPGIVLDSDWTLCTGGSFLSTFGLTWPESGSGLAATWAAGCLPSSGNDDGLVKVGFVTILPNSQGEIRFLESFEFGNAEVLDCSLNSTLILPENLGTATIGDASGVDWTTPIIDSGFQSLWPNPATNLINLTFELESPRTVTIRLHDSLGRLVDTPFHSLRLPAGHSVKSWSPNRLISGVYFLETTWNSGETASRRLTWLNR